jgi:mono/diheme cytochrome c family protein
VIRRGGTRITGIAIAIAACKSEPTKRPLSDVRLSLRARGAPVATRSAAELRALGGERITVNDPHEHRAIDLEGIRATTLFDAVLGPSWRSAEEIVATCLDGFHPSVPVHLFLEREAYVAYARPESVDFAVQEDEKHTPVGPYYLVWKKAPGDDPPEPAWPYQVTALEATDFATRFAAAIPPRDADPLTREGFERFRTFCLPCHTINGAGGAVGPELNYPVSVTEYFAEPILRKWIVDPKEVRWNAKMPVPLPADDGQARAIDAIVLYLKAMAGAKRAPPQP